MRAGAQHKTLWLAGVSADGVDQLDQQDTEAVGSASAQARTGAGANGVDPLDGYSSNYRDLVWMLTLPDGLKSELSLSKFQKSTHLG